MNAARAYRRLKEIEEKKLANRLMLLKLELDKSRHKIDETRARSKSILEHRSKIEERNRMKEEETARRQKETQRAQYINQEIRKRMDTYRRANVASVQVAKIQEAKRIVDEHLENKQFIKEQRDKELVKAQEMRSIVQQQRSEGREQRKMLISKRQEDARKAFQQRLEEEAERSAEFEQRVTAMEAEERRLIDQLASAQEEQRMAYAELEQALLTSKQQLQALRGPVNKGKQADAEQLMLLEDKTKNSAFREQVEKSDTHNSASENEAPVPTSVPSS